jgi:predicted GIY-YIG superfamily endonuclease
MGVYAIRNTLDGAMYVGSTPDVDRRWEQHRGALDRGSHPSDQLQAAWLRYGAEAFELIILEQVEDDDALAQAEQRWVDRYSAEDLHHIYNGQARVVRKRRRPPILDEAAQRRGGTAPARSGNGRVPLKSMLYLVGSSAIVVVAVKLLGLD